MKKSTAIVGASVVGMGLGMLLAPQAGRRTRSMIRDKAIKYSKDATNFVEGKAVHLSNKSKGYFHYVRSAFGSLVGAADRA